MDHQLVALLGSFVAMLLGIWKITADLRAETESAIARVFKRFDDHKETVDKKLIILTDLNDQKYMRTDLCALTKETFKEEFKRLNEKLDRILGAK